jgi:hypothetical protein
MMDPTKQQHQILCKSQKKYDGDPGNDQTSVLGRKHELHMESPNSPRPKKVRQLKNKVNSMPIIFFTSTVNSAYYCDVLQ